MWFSTTLRKSCTEITSSTASMKVFTWERFLDREDFDHDVKPGRPRLSWIHSHSPRQLCSQGCLPIPGQLSCFIATLLTACLTCIALMSLVLRSSSCLKLIFTILRPSGSSVIAIRSSERFENRETWLSKVRQLAWVSWKKVTFYVWYCIMFVGFSLWRDTIQRRINHCNKKTDVLSVMILFHPQSAQCGN